MHVFHTVGVPPSNGSNILATIGCTQNRSKALTNNVVAKNNDIHFEPGALAGTAACRRR
jgi:hypothetical protein